MARLRGSMLLFAFQVFLFSRVESTPQQPCHRVFPLQLTAAAMPCRYICAYYNGYPPQYHVRGEDDGTFCRKHGKGGVCWYGECLTRYGPEDEWSQQADASSKVPLRIRKRDVTSTTKGASISKTVGADGDSSFSTKTVNTVKTVKTTTGAEESGTGDMKDFKGRFMTQFSTDQASKGTKNSMPSEPNIDIDPFSTKNAPSTSRRTETFFSGGREPPTVKNSGVKVTVHRGPNGEQVTTRTVRKLVITHGPTKTVRRIIIRHGSSGEGANLLIGGPKTFATKTISVRQGSTPGTHGHKSGGKTEISRKTSQITALHTTGARTNPLSTIVNTIKQERISGGQNVGGSSRGTKTVSTVAVTNRVRPSVSVVGVTKQGVTPLTAASLGTSNTGTLRGVEVEVPGYTAGLRHNWKWVLARRVGVYPPYVQALDPDVLFYKLGIPKPNLPSLPGAVQNILNRVPVHPVGSDIYGYLLSKRILEKIRGFTEGVNGLARLKSMLSTTNTSNMVNSNLLNSFFTGTEWPAPGAHFLQKLLLASLTGSGGDLKSPVSGVFGGAYTGPYGSSWGMFPGSQFAASSWPFYYGRQPQIGRFGLNPSLYSGSPFGSYDSLGSAKSSSDMGYTFSEDERFVPSTKTPFSENDEFLFGESRDLQSLLAPTTAVGHTSHGRHRQSPSYDESLETAREKLAHALGEGKLRQLLKLPRERESPLRRLLKSFYRINYDDAPILLRQLGVAPNTRLYNRVMQYIAQRRKHREVYNPSKYHTTYGEGSDENKDLISALRALSGKSNEPKFLDYFPSSSYGTGSSNNKLRALAQLLLDRKRRPEYVRSHGSFDSSGTNEAVDTILDYSRRQPSSDRVAEISKQITKALLTSSEHPMSTNRRRDGHLSKLISVHGTSRTDKRPQGLTEPQEISTTYHTSKGEPTAPINILPAMASALEVTRQIAQPSQQAALLGVNSFSTTPTGPSPLQPYPQYVSQPLYPTGGSSVSDQAVMISPQLVSPTGSVYGSSLGQSSSTMMTGTAGYSGYATMPSNTAYVSQYATQPYYLGTSLYGNHPHYVVEGHEAPGTRWQLRVWRHPPGMSSVAPGFSGFGSSHLGSVVTRAREAVTSGLHVGSQPGQFGFTTFGSSVPGGNAFGTTSQYVVRAADGSIVLSRAPLNFRSPTQISPASNVVISQTTKQTTKTTAGGSLPNISGGLSSNSFGTAVDRPGTEGIGKSSLSELTKTKGSHLFGEMPSDSGSENKGSPFSSDGSSSSSLQQDVDLSQSKLRR